MAELVAVEFDPFKRSPFDSALAAEGLTGKAADIARSIYSQESGSGVNTKTSNRGAVGPMQVIPTTFQAVADKGWDIKDEIHNLRAGIRYVKQGYDASGGDPALTGAYYYGGPGGLAKAKRGIGVSDPKNPSFPNTLEYGAQVAARVPKEKGLIQRGVEAVIPSANAAEPELVPVDFDPFATRSDTPRVEVRGTSADEPQPSGGARFIGGVVQGGKDLLGGAVRGAGSIGATLLWPIDKAEDVIRGDRGPSLSGLLTAQQPLSRNEERRLAMDGGLQAMGVDTNSLAFQGARLGSEVAGTLGVGGALGAGARAAGAAPRIVNALQSGGFKVGGSSQGLAQGAMNALARVGGGAATGAASAGLVNPDSAGTGALVGAAAPPVVAGLGALGSAVAKTIRGPMVPSNILQAASKAQDAGYVIPPTQVKPTLANRLLEGMSGKITTAQNASARNQQTTNELVKKAIGAQELSPQGLDAVRRQANQAYDALGQAGQFQADKAFQEAVQKTGVPNSQLTQNFPALANKQLKEMVDSFASTTNFDAQSAIEAIKTLRAAQRTSAASSDPAAVALGRAQGKISKALEDLVDRNLAAQGNQDLLGAYRDARQTLAKVYDVEKAMNPATGNIDVRKLGPALKKGALTGELKKAAEFGQAFPKASQTVENMGSLPQTSPLDWTAGGAMSMASGSPLGMLGVVARPAARAATLSGPVQKNLLRQPTQFGIGINRNALQMIGRSAPVLSSDR